MDNNTARVRETDVQAIVDAVAASMILVPGQALAALRQVRDGVITGEGPTTGGRMHFSRTIDAADARLCERILVHAGDGGPVSRDEAEMLFEINAAGAERADGGRFDDLFVKAVAHHVMAKTGREVPPRALALSPQTELTDWATPGEADAEVLAWIAGHVRRQRRHSRVLMTLAAVVIGAAASSLPQSLANLIDIAS